ncbi:hypothetical protein [Streptomyces sp. NPDC046197]|uniref:hypothetical protein n=1 Tax=Streptomyces sp. NPDC046197 TaxID=3154337 RepID=UPI0033D23BAC
MCTSADHPEDHTAQAGAGRRGFLRATALLGAAATAGGGTPRAAGRRRGGTRQRVRGASLDGNGDPWADTWFYSNPVFVDVVST